MNEGEGYAAPLKYPGDQLMTSEETKETWYRGCSVRSGTS
jgi:hypothetical protein